MVPQVRNLGSRASHTRRNSEKENKEVLQFLTQMYLEAEGL